MTRERMVSDAPARGRGCEAAPFRPPAMSPLRPCRSGASSRRGPGTRPACQKSRPAREGWAGPSRGCAIRRCRARGRRRRPGRASARCGVCPCRSGQRAPRCPDALYAGTLDPPSAAIPSLSSIHAGIVVADAPESIIPTVWTLATPVPHGMRPCGLALTLMAGSMTGLRPPPLAGTDTGR